MTSKLKKFDKRPILKMEWRLPKLIEIPPTDKKKEFTQINPQTVRSITSKIFPTGVATCICIRHRNRFDPRLLTLDPNIIDYLNSTLPPPTSGQLDSSSSDGDGPDSSSPTYETLPPSPNHEAGDEVTDANFFSCFDRRHEVKVNQEDKTTNLLMGSAIDPRLCKTGLKMEITNEFTNEPPAKFKIMNGYHPTQNYGGGRPNVGNFTVTIKNWDDLTSVTRNIQLMPHPQKGFVAMVSNQTQQIPRNRLANEFPPQIFHVPMQ